MSCNRTIIPCHFTSPESAWFWCHNIKNMMHHSDLNPEHHGYILPTANIWAHQTTTLVHRKQALEIGDRQNISDIR